MKEKLDNGFTLYLSNNKNKLKGVYLKSVKSGLILYELSEDDLLLISNFPNILKKLADLYILQIYKSNNYYVLAIGNIVYEGPYAEEKYFDVLLTSFTDSLMLGLDEINKNLNNIREKNNQKIYYMYGNDKYRIMN